MKKPNNVPSEKMASSSSDLGPPFRRALHEEGQNPRRSRPSSDSSSVAPPASPEGSMTTNGSSVPTALISNDDRERVSRQIRNLSIASGGSLAVLIVSVVPLPVLAGMLVVVSSFLALFLKLYQRALLEYQAILQGQGFGHYLPESMYEALANSSFHEWLVEGNFVQEWSFLMLYAIPGMRREQIEAYVDRLTPRHQQFVRRRGLGQFFGQTFMRHLVGDRNLNENDHHHHLINIPPTISEEGETAAPPLVPRRLTLENVPEDEASELDPNDPDQFARFIGLSSGGGAETEDAQSREQLERGWVVEHASTSGAMTASTVQTVETDDDNEVKTHDSEGNGAIDNNNSSTSSSDLAGEVDVILDAFYSSVNHYYEVVSDMALSTVSSVSSTYLFRASVAVAVASIGVGAFGLYTGNYSSRDFSRNFQSMFGSASSSFRPSFPSPSILLSSAMASGGTATIMMMFGFRRSKGDGGNSNNQGDNA